LKFLFFDFRKISDEQSSEKIRYRHCGRLPVAILFFAKKGE